MSRHCVLHIGTEKTGTTSIQVGFSEGRAALDAQGVRYCRSLGVPAHRLLSVHAMNVQGADDAFQNLHIVTQQDHTQFRQRLDEAFAAEIAEFPEAKLWIISSEHLHSRLKNIDQVRRVKAFLDPHFESIEVYIHLRPQIDMAISLASTMARIGGAVTPTYFEEITPSSPYYDYLGLYSTWAEVFFEQNLRCIAFRREPDFARRLKDDYQLNLPDRVLDFRLNSALDVRVIALVNAVAHNDPKVRIPMDFLDELPVNERLSPGRGRAQEIQAQFDTDNARLIERCRDLQPGDLTPDWSRYPIEGNLELLDVPCVFEAELAQVLRRYNAALERVKQKT